MADTTEALAKPAADLPRVRNIVEELLEAREHALAQLRVLDEWRQQATAEALQALSRSGGYLRVAYPEQTLALENTLAALDAQMWDRLVVAADFETFMPSEDLRNLTAQIAEHKTPPFDREHVYAVLDAFFADAPRLFAKRVAAVYNSLSRFHRTNTGKGFGERLIVGHVFEDRHILTANYHRKQQVHDLLSVCEYLTAGNTWTFPQTDDAFCAALREPGKWVRITEHVEFRAYVRAGTLHVRLDQDLVQQLNRALAYATGPALPHAGDWHRGRSGRPEYP